MTAMIRVDFHSHTCYSPDSATSLKRLLQTARRRGLNRLAVTDHNTIQGALRAYELDPDLVIIGEEIETQKGELLALFVQEEIPAGLPPQETIARLREQNAFISISHPFDPYRSAWTMQDMEELAPLVDAVEVFNARCFTAAMNEKAAQFARMHALPGTAGSDAHWHGEVGNALLELPVFSNADELRMAIRGAHVVGKRTTFLVRFISSFARLQKLLVQRT